MAVVPPLIYTYPAVGFVVSAEIEPAPVTVIAPALAVAVLLNSIFPVPVLRDPPTPLVTARTLLALLL